MHQLFDTQSHCYLYNSNSSNYSSITNHHLQLILLDITGSFQLLVFYISYLRHRYNFLKLASIFIFCSLLILFHFPVHLHMTILSHLISCASWSTNYSFAHLPTCHFLLPFLPCYFPGFSVHQIPILFTISMFNFATLLPYTSPPPSFTSFIVTISPLFYSSSNFISDILPLFSSTLISFLLPFTYLAPHTFGPFL